MSNYNSIEDFNNALLNAKIALPDMMLPLVKVAQNNMAREIRARVSVTGESSDGSMFSPYSPKYAKRKSKYGQTALGKKTDNKNFWFSGKMWGSFGVSHISLQGQRIISNIGFLGQSGYTSTADLNDYHSDREGKGIAFPNEEEELMLVDEIENILFQSLEQLI